MLTRMDHMGAIRGKEPPMVTCYRYPSYLFLSYFTGVYSPGFSSHEPRQLVLSRFVPMYYYPQCYFFVMLILFFAKRDRKSVV